MQSPFRYPGGKSDFSLTAFEIVSRCGLAGREFFEPYAGSAAVSMALLQSDVVPCATLVERDPLVFGFWSALVTRADELLERFIELPITLKTWHQFQPLLRVDHPEGHDVVDLGLAGLFFNRTNFSGILNGGPIGGKGQKSEYTIDCRTNKDEIVSRLLTISTLADRLSVTFGDAVEVIKKHQRRKDALFYVDPPYFVKGELLYRHFYRLGDHKALATALEDVQFPWFLSYDVHHVIEFLYEKQHVKRIRFQYSARSPKNHEEYLISNFEIPFQPLVTRLPR